MRVLHVAAEVYPLVKTGGLADVGGALPPALARRGIEMRTLIPGYPAVMAGVDEQEPDVGDLMRAALNLRRAIDLHSNCGAKKDLERAERLLKKHAGPAS